MTSDLPATDPTDDPRATRDALELADFEPAEPLSGHDESNAS